MSRRIGIYIPHTVRVYTPSGRWVYRANTNQPLRKVGGNLGDDAQVASTLSLRLAQGNWLLTMKYETLGESAPPSIYPAAGHPADVGARVSALLVTPRWEVEDEVVVRLVVSPAAATTYTVGLPHPNGGYNRNEIENFMLEVEELA